MNRCINERMECMHSHPYLPDEKLSGEKEVHEKVHSGGRVLGGVCKGEEGVYNS